MAWSYSRKTFGVCGNFRFSFIDLTDVKATRSIIKPEGINSVKFTASTNTTDNDDVLLTKTLAWTGKAAVYQENHLEDTGEVFDPRLGMLVVHNVETGDAKLGLHAYMVYDGTDPDDLSLIDNTGTATDLFPDGNEDYVMYNERVIQTIAGTGDDDGTLLVIGD